MGYDPADRDLDRELDFVMNVPDPEPVNPPAPWEHPGHNPVQHRDGKPPWCDGCGWSSPVPARPAVQVRRVGGGVGDLP